MRKLRVFEHLSLDGVIQNTDDDGDFPFGDWTAPYRSAEGGEVVGDLQGTHFDLLLGRRTYDLWSPYWPKAPKGPIADPFNAGTKFVVTHRPKTLSWGPHQALGPDFLADVERLKAQDGPDLLLWGSSTLTSPLIGQGLVDELVLLVYPVLLGRGKRLFSEGTPPQTFKNLSSKALPSGIVVQRYQVVGPYKAGNP